MSRVQAVLQRPTVRQFLKFCIVGASSTAIDFTIYMLLIERLHIDRVLGVSLMVGRLLAQFASFACAVSNGFYWNSRWTFRTEPGKDWKATYFRFVLTNTIGLALNVTILSVVSHFVPDALTNALAGRLRDPDGFLGKVCATLVVVFWNFTASKYWTFKK